MEVENVLESYCPKGNQLIEYITLDLDLSIPQELCMNSGAMRVGSHR